MGIGVAAGAPAMSPHPPPHPQPPSLLRSAALPSNGRGERLLRPRAREGRGGRRLVVSPDGPYTTIQAALAEARDGDVVEVRAGIYHGPLVVGKSVTLQGVGWPVDRRRRAGTVVTLAAPARRYGASKCAAAASNRTRTTPALPWRRRARGENNRLRDVLFGIFVAQAEGRWCAATTSPARPEYEQGRKGDGIRLWYSPTRWSRAITSMTRATW